MATRFAQAVAKGVCQFPTPSRDSSASSARPREGEDPALTCHIECAFCFEILRWMPAFVGMSGVCGKIQARGIARILWSAPARPSHAPEKIEGSGAPGNAEACEASWAAWRKAARDACEASPFPLRSGKGASRRSTGGDFGSRARASGWGPTPETPLIRRASARLQPHRVQPSKAAGHRAGGRVPATSRVQGYEPRPRAPHPAPSSARLRKTPLVRAGRKDYKHGHNERSIVLDRNIWWFVRPGASPAIHHRHRRGHGAPSARLCPPYQASLRAKRSNPETARCRFAAWELRRCAPRNDGRRASYRTLTPCRPRRPSARPACPSSSSSVRPRTSPIYTNRCNDASRRR